MTAARLGVRMLEITMNSPATARSTGCSRLALIAAGFLALLGSFVVTAPAQAGYYGNSYYGSNPCSYRPRCGYSPYRSYNNGCSACGCYPRPGSPWRPGGPASTRPSAKPETGRARLGTRGD